MSKSDPEIPDVTAGSSQVRTMREKLETETSRNLKDLFIKYALDGVCTITANLVGDGRRSTLTLTPKGRKVVLFSLEKFVWTHPQKENIPIDELVAQMPTFIKEVWFLCAHEKEIPQEMQDIDKFMEQWEKIAAKKKLATALGSV